MWHSEGSERDRPLYDCVRQFKIKEGRREGCSSRPPPPPPSPLPESTPVVLSQLPFLRIYISLPQLHQIHDTARHAPQSHQCSYLKKVSDERATLRLSDWETVVARRMLQHSRYMFGLIRWGLCWYACAIVFFVDHTCFTFTLTQSVVSRHREI